MALFKNRPPQGKRIKFPRRRSRLGLRRRRIFALLFLLLLIFMAVKLFSPSSFDQLDSGSVEKSRIENSLENSKAKENKAGESRKSEKDGGKFILSPQASNNDDAFAKAQESSGENQPRLSSGLKINLAGISDPDFNLRNKAEAEKGTLAPRANLASQRKTEELEKPQTEGQTGQGNRLAEPAQAEAGQIDIGQAETRQAESERANIKASGRAGIPRKNGFDNPWGVPFVGYSLKEASAIIEKKYKNIKPGTWTDKAPGIVSKIPNKPAHLQGPVLALTINLAGQNSLDPGLLDFLEKENIPVSFFATSQWISKHNSDFSKIIKNPLLRVEGHGKKHIPISATGLRLDNKIATASILELLQEVEGNMRDIQRLTNRRPQWFRGAYSLYEESAVVIINQELNLPMAGFSLRATGSYEDMLKKIESAQDGDILMLESEGDGKLLQVLIKSVPTLKAKGFTIISLLPPLS